MGLLWGRRHSRGTEGSLHKTVRGRPQWDERLGVLDPSSMTPALRDCQTKTWHGSSRWLVVSAVETRIMYPEARIHWDPGWGQGEEDTPYTYTEYFGLVPLHSPFSFRRNGPIGRQGPLVHGRVGEGGEWVVRADGRTAVSSRMAGLSACLGWVCEWSWGWGRLSPSLLPAWLFPWFVPGLRSPSPFPPLPGRRKKSSYPATSKPLSLGTASERPGVSHGSTAEKKSGRQNQGESRRDLKIGLKTESQGGR